MAVAASFQADTYEGAAVHAAARFGNVSCLSALMSIGASPDLVDSIGWSPLKWAAFGGHVECVRVLLGALPPAEHSPAAAAASISAISASDELAAEIAEDSRSSVPSALTIACEGGHTDVASLLVRARASLLQTGPDEQTPLIYAARAGHAETCAELLRLARAQGRASVVMDAQDIRCRTALMHAAGRNHAEAVRVLLQLGADRYLVDVDARTALQHAWSAEPQGATAAEFVKSVSSFARTGLPTLKGEGVGGLMIDMGTGELKLMVVAHFESAQVHELC